MLNRLAALFVLALALPLSGTAETVDIAILTEPSGALIEYTIGGQTTRLPDATPTLAAFPLGARIDLTLTLNGYQPAQSSFVVSRTFPGVDVSLVAEGNTAPIQITTIPGATLWARLAEGAEIELGTANVEGLFTLNYIDLRTRLGLNAPATPFFLRLASPGHQSLDVESLRFQETEQTLELLLPPLGKNLRFTSTPIGARVFQDGHPIGLTPFTIELSWENLSTFRAELPGYKPLERTLAYSSILGDPHLIEFSQFERLDGDFTLNLLLPDHSPLPADLRSELNVLVNSQPYELEGSRVLGVGVGRHRLLILHDNFMPYEAEIEVTLQGVPVEVTLSPRDAVVALILDQPDATYTVSLDQTPLELIAGNLVLIPGFQTITLTADFGGGRTVTREFNVPGGAQSEWQLTVPSQPVALTPVVSTDRRTPIRLPDLDLTLNWVPSGSSGLWVGVNEITQRQYQLIANTNPSRLSEIRTEDTFEEVTRTRVVMRMVGGRLTPVTIHETVRERVPGTATPLLNNPVENLSWTDALAFCAKLNQDPSLRNLIPEGYEFRLPTAAEWTAAYGTDRFVGGASSSNLAQYAWHSGNSNGQHHPVRSKRANPHGLHDIAGNVAEWTVEITPNPSGSRWTAQFERPQARGGAFNQSTDACARDALGRETSPSPHVGFRLVLAPKAELLRASRN